MAVALLDQEAKARFIAMAEAGIADDKTPAMIRADLAEQFDLSNSQVGGALKRIGIKLFETRRDLKGIMDIDVSVCRAVVARANELIKQGTGLIRGRAVLSVEFGIFETSISIICDKYNGPDLRTEQGKFSVKPLGPKTSPVSLGCADYDPDEDITLKAASTLRKKQKDVRFDRKRGQWWLDHRPVSRVQLIQSAGLGV